MAPTGSQAWGLRVWSLRLGFGVGVGGSRHLEHAFPRKKVGCGACSTRRIGNSQVLSKVANVGALIIRIGFWGFLSTIIV